MNLVLGGSALLILLKMLKSKHIFKALLMSTVQGVFAMFAVNALGIVTNVTISVNALTLAIACVGGIPGVVFLLVLRLIVGI